MISGSTTLGKALLNTNFNSAPVSNPPAEGHAPNPQETFTASQSPLNTADAARRLAQMAQEHQALLEKSGGGGIGSDMAFHAAINAQMQQLELINRLQQQRDAAPLPQGTSQCPPASAPKSSGSLQTILQMAHHNRLQANFREGGVSAAHSGELALLNSLNDQRHGPHKDMKELMVEQQQWNSINNARANFGLGAAVGKQAEIIDGLLADGKGGGLLGQPVLGNVDTLR